jgi:hypothetical protein
MKRELPRVLTAATAILMILSFFVPHQVVSVPADFAQMCAVIIVAFGIVLGGASVLRANLGAIASREPHWPYKAVLVVSLLATVMIGAVDGVRNQGAFLDSGTLSRWMYDNLYSPTSATMFSLLAFFIASAALRVLRVRTLEAGLLVAAALIVILGRVPAGDALTGWLPANLRLGALQEWIMDVPQSAARRAIMIGAALGVMATGLRVMLGIERAFPGGEE